MQESGPLIFVLEASSAVPHVYCTVVPSAKCQDVFLLTASVCAKAKFCYIKIQGSWSIIVLNWMKVLYGSLPKMLNMNIELYMFNVYSKLKKQICIWHCQLYGSNSALIPTGFKETSFENSNFYCCIASVAYCITMLCFYEETYYNIDFLPKLFWPWQFVKNKESDPDPAN